MSDLTEKPADWNKLAGKIFDEIQAWNTQHPEATFTQIEEALDQRLAHLRSQILAASIEAQNGSLEPTLKGSQCEKCGVKLHKRGKHSRRVITHHNQTIELGGFCITP